MVKFVIEWQGWGSNGATRGTRVLGCRFLEGGMPGRQKGFAPGWLLSVTLAATLLWAGSALRAKAQSSASAKTDEGESAILVGAGDIVGCRDPHGALATAKLIAKIPGTVFTLGDMVYDAASAAQFQD